MSTSTTKDSSSEKKSIESVIYNPGLFYISPLQTWVGRLVKRTVTTQTMQDKWLPVFSRASTRLRDVFNTLKKSHGSIIAFLAQWETGGLLLLSAILEIISVAASLSTPIVLRELLRHDRDEKLAWLLVLLSVTATLAGRAKDQVSKTQTAYVDIMLQTAIFDKSLRLSPEARIAHPPAKIINLCNSDARSISIYCGGIHKLWSCSLQLILIAALSNNILGPSVLFGYILLVIFFVIQSWVNKLTRAFMAQNIRLEDHRLAKIRELLINIKSVKALSYENVFRKRIGVVREEQLAMIRRFLTAGWTIYSAINDSIPPGLASAAFIAYYLTGNRLEADVVFPALAYFNMLYSPLFGAAEAIAGHFAVLPSLRRVKELMIAEETELHTITPSEASGSDGSGVAIIFQNSLFGYAKKYTDDDSSATFKLELEDLDIPKDQLTVVIGPTGSGKTSLLQAILGEMTLLRGTRSICGTFSYVGQDAWIMSGTLRDNIVFMKEYQKERYQQVIKLCGLDKDFQSVPKADLAQVGDAGSKLSGGQRARVALARALYANTDILLLDDPLSAVDGKVRHLLFDTIRALQKTVILVTLHTHFVPLSDHVVALKDGRVEWSGSAKSLLTNKRLRSEYVGNYQAYDDDHGTQPSDKPEADGEDEKVSSSQMEDLVEEEERAKGAIKWRVLQFYLRNTGGRVQVIGVGLLGLLLMVFKIMSNYWFVWWINLTFSLSQAQYLCVYLGLNAGMSLMTAFVGTSLVYGSIRASRRIHNTIIDNLLTAPLSFFHRQPVGRILNRLTADVKSLDTRMLNSFDQIIKSGTSLAASLCLITSSTPLMIAAVFPYLLISGWYLSQYRVCARELQRSLAILQSPITAIVSESLSSPSTLKAYGAADFLVRKHGEALDVVLSGTIVRRSLDTWLMFRAEIASVALLLLVALLTVYGVISGVLGGLALSLATTLTKNVYYMAWSVTDLEIQMNSIERLEKYHEDLPQEGVSDGADAEAEPAAGWLETGRLDMRAVSLKYPSRQTPALDHITLKIRGGQRVGVVGRTGSGKSTLVSSISRLVDITDGSICLDGIDISSVQPATLRASVHTLPQEPLIFEGTLRDNLDPEHQQTDEKLLDALEKCQIKSFFVEKFAGKDPLKQRLRSGGADLSAGQRQLLCAARLLLTSPAVLLVDEAAANVDAVSDEALQRALQGFSPETTMLIIAHRAGSLAWLDRIIVMSGGKIVEDDTPLALLESGTADGGAESYYRQAVKHEGEVMFRQALKVARGNVWLG